MERRDTSERAYEVKCEDGHSQKLTATELERLIHSGEYQCWKCQKKNLSLALDLELECHVCEDVLSVSDLNEAKNTMEDGCGDCKGKGLNEDSIHVSDSWECFKSVYNWKCDGSDEEPLKRKGRTDYWEAVIHFCKPHEFASIYRDKKITAGETGYFKVPAVCLTETPAGNWKELRDRHGAFGYVFLKRDLIKKGGGPAVYLSDELIRAQKSSGGFCDKLKPFVNLLRINSTMLRRHDFLYEREWRLPCDLLLSEVRPYAVVIGDYDVDTDGWEDIWRARIDFEEMFEDVDGQDAEIARNDHCFQGEE